MTRLELIWASKRAFFLGDASYKLPSCLLNCETLISLKLTYLEVRVCGFVNFSKLTSLSISCSIIGDGLIEGLLKGCPLLKDLATDRLCMFPLEIPSYSSSSLRLKCLTIKLAHRARVDIDAPNLQVLKICNGSFGYFFLKVITLLRDAYLNVVF